MDPRRDILRAWTDQLYKEYENVRFHFGVKLPTPVIRIAELSGKWGEWAPDIRTITISRALIERHPWDIVIEVLKHEMAHQLVTTQGGALFRDERAHGPLFQEACRRLGVPEWAASASGALPASIPQWRHRGLSDAEERLLKRAEKLLALAESSNEHEAALAMQRVRQLYAKYNLERLAAREAPSHVYCIIDLRRRRVAADDSMIFSILTEHFFVRAIYAGRFDRTALVEHKVVELLGTRENVLMAEYVYFFLRQKIDALWRQYRRGAGAGRGLKARRSYMLGVLAGFRDTLAATPAAPAATAAAAESIGALLKLADRQLDTFVHSRHPKLAARRWGAGRGDRESYFAGHAAGSTITLHRGLTHSQGSRGHLLPSGRG